MIDSLTGPLLEKTPGSAVVQCAGVGYLVQMPSTDAGALPPLGGTATVYTVLHVTEGDVSLFGFADRESRSVFRMLIAVSGVGPKVALAILSVLPPDRVLLAASAGDFKAFTAATGVGPKLAQRLVLELKDKAGKLAQGLAVSDFSPGVAAPAGAQAVAALVSLGYTQSEAAAALSGLDTALPVQELIRLALQQLGKR